MRMLLATLAFVLVSSPAWAEPFTDVAAILAISREDQTEALKTRLLKKEVTLPAAIVALTTFEQVSRDDYLTFAHQIGARGKVTLKGGKEYTWEIELDYAATVTGPGGATIYLLHPRLKQQGK